MEIATTQKFFINDKKNLFIYSDRVKKALFQGLWSANELGSIVHNIRGEGVNISDRLLKVQMIYYET